MVLVHPKPGRARQSSRRTFVESDLTIRNLTVSALTKTSRILENPEDNAEHPLLFFGSSQLFLLPDVI
jgi:hypothetical protein